MGTPYRRPGWLRRQAKNHPTMLVVGTLCVAAVVIEVAVLSGVLSLSPHHGGASGPTPPNLNPYDEQIDHVWANIVYTGGQSGYFVALQHQDLCGAACQTLHPISTQTTPTIGILFFFNVTNTASTDQNISLPQLGISGSDQSVFKLATLCCYTAAGESYSEPLVGPLPFLASGNTGSTIGLEGFVYSTVTIPESSLGYYVLYFNVTSLSSP
ncbi:MAG TPA: hypothetical protein VML94_07420 [Thermoplasmata archaeon]|nr:hypothetical protein [Thermoplasmata archaeon]